MLYLDPEYLFESRLDILNSRIAEFQHFIGIGQDDVIVLLILKCALKMGGVLTELMLAHQIAVDQQINRVVKSGSRDPVFFILHAHIQAFNIKMTTVIIDFMKYRKTLRCLAVLVNFQIPGKNLLDFFLCL